MNDITYIIKITKVNNGYLVNIDGVDHVAKDKKEIAKLFLLYVEQDNI